MAVEQQLIDYIRKARLAGQPDDRSKVLLIQNGWTAEEIKEALVALGDTQQEPKPEPTIEPQIQQQPKPEQPVQVKPEPQIQQQPEAQPQAQHQVSGEPEIKMRPEPEIKPQFTPQTQAQNTQSKYQAKPEPPHQMPSAESSMPKVKKGSHFIIKFLITLILISIIGVGGFFALKQFGFLDKILFFDFSPKIVSPINEVSNTNKTANNQSFAPYLLETTKYTPAVPSYELALADINNFDDFQKSYGDFSQSQKDALLQNNFFIQANYDKFYSANSDGLSSRNDDWTALYKQMGGSYNEFERLPENSVFITSDFVLHVFHKIIDEEFSYIEELNFYPALADLSSSSLKASAQAYASSENPEQKASYERLSAYFLVSSAILDNASVDYASFKSKNYVDDSQSDTKANVLARAGDLATENSVSDNARSIAEQEISLIFDAKSIVPSPLLGAFQPDMPEDYTQFTPRSHYTKNVILRNYFRAMMWYGRMNFLLNSPELTRDASNITNLITGDQLEKWESIYLPTSFFVGQSDDLTIYDYKKAIAQTKFNASVDGANGLNTLQTELLGYQNPQIMSSVVISPDVFDTSKEDLQNTTKGFRLIGQRFTPDAFIFSSLTQGDEAADPLTGQKLPSTPTALMVSTLMGSQESGQLLNLWIQNNAPNSDQVLANKMQTLQDYFDATTQNQWTQNIYWSWLYTIKSLFTETTDKTNYPMFMKSEDWNKKNLQSFLGSWTELKHDTLLYAKQSYAELGAGGPEETDLKPVPKGYVEPNIEFFDRLIALVNMSKDGLARFGILPDVFVGRNDTFLDDLKFYRQIAVSEISNKVISDENFERLRLSAGQLDYILSAPDSQVQLEKNARSAIIADVHTDVKQWQILYEADGIPNYIYVAVKDANGTRLTKGLVYSYYEFTDALGTRIDDLRWQRWNYSDTIKQLKLPDWSKSLIK